MREAAADGMIITVYCGLCRRRANYWASDLLQVVGPLHQVHLPMWPCSRCKTKDYIDMTWKVVAPGDLQGMIVRRPVQAVTRWIWRNEKA